MWKWLVGLTYAALVAIGACYAVDLRPIGATVESLTSLPREPGGNDSRGIGAERQVFVVEGYLGTRRDESDGDWHIVIFGMENQRVSLVAEIPNPECWGACRSGFAAQYAAARAAYESCATQPNPEDRPIHVRLQGVGFFDHGHGQVGAAPNQFELHPVLRFECLR